MKRKLFGLLALILTTHVSFGQSFLEIDVSEGGTTLADAIQQANGFTGGGPVTINILASSYTDQTISLTDQMIVGLANGNTGLTIVGNGVTLDMGGNDRAFFIGSGNVAIQNLTIANGFARGGNGGDNGGGGAGLGGGIFVANPAQITSATGGFSNPNLTIPTNVTLTNVTFFNNQAQGGAGGTSQNSAGGGGGMGGNGGNGDGTYEAVGGGGGGFGNDADGGNYNAGWNGGPGAMVFTPSSSAASGGNGADESNNGGAAGGGGGLGQTGDLFSKGGGGGGANGDNGGDTDDGNGGNGGFGGGGGGASGYGNNAGNGGFGGGGGGAVQDTDSITAGNGGFGGGGGAGNTSGSGGFGGSAGYGSSGQGGYAGAGAGLGGAIFVMDGANLIISGNSTFNQNAALPNSNNGALSSSAYGGNIFLGGTLTINVDPGQTTHLANLGGAGVTNDPNVAGHTSDPNANGDLVVTGGGTVELGGVNNNSGSTTIHSGTLIAATNSESLGTKTLTIGENSGDNATFIAQFDSNFVMAAGTGTGASAPIQLAVAAGSTGTLVLNMSQAFFFSASGINGGEGTATFISQNVPTGVGLYINLSGNLNFVVDGGQTAMETDTAANTFTGATTVQAQGQLITGGTHGSLANTGSLLITGSSTLTLGQSEGINDTAQITIEDSTLETAAGITETFGDLQSENAVIDFDGIQSTLTFNSINLAVGDLTINGWTSEAEIFVLNGITGNLTDIQFYDINNDYLGYGALNGNILTVVPEPSSAGLAAVGLLWLNLLLRTRRKKL